MDDDSNVIDVTAAPAVATATVSVEVGITLPLTVREVEVVQTLPTEGESADEVEADEVLLTTQELCIRLGLHVPFTLLVGTGATVEQNAAGEQAWRQSDFNLIVDSLIEHLESLKDAH